MRVPPVEQRGDLVTRAPDRRGGGDDLGPHPHALHHPRRQPVDRRLVQPRHRAQRAGDQVQFVLDHQVGRVQPVPAVQRPAAPRLRCPEEAAIVRPVDMAEERTRLTVPRQRRELVHRGDQEGGQAAIDRLVHAHHRQRTVAGERARHVHAAQLQIGRRVGTRHAAKALRGKGGAAPRARLDRCRRARIAPAAIGAHPLDCGAFALVALAAQPIGTGVGADPQADLDRPVAQHPPAVAVAVIRPLAQQLQRTDQPGRTPQLVQRQQPERIAHDHRHARAQHAARPQPPQRDGKGGQPQIGLGLAAAGGKEQQVGGVAIRMPPVRHARQIEQDEGQLEWPPRGRAVPRPPGPRRIRHRTIGDGKGGPRPRIPGQQRDPRRDPPARDILRGDQRFGGPKPLRRTRNIGGIHRPALRHRPVAIGRRQRRQRRAQRRPVARRQFRQPVHAEGHPRHCRRHRPLHRCVRHVRGMYPPHPSVGIRDMPGGAPQARRIGRRVPVVQVRQLIVPVIARDPRQVGLRDEARVARQRQPHLIGIGQIAVARRRLQPLVDQKHGHHLHRARLAGRQPQAEGAGTHRQLQPATGPRRRRRAGQRAPHHAFAFARQRQRDGTFARHPPPCDRRPAKLAAAFQHLGRQRRLGHVIAPCHAHFQCADAGIDHGRQPDRARQETAAGRGRIGLVMIARRAADAEPVQFGQEAVDLLQFGIRRHVGLGRQFARWRDEARQVPARRAFPRRQPFLGQIVIRRLARPDQVAAQAFHQPGAHACRAHSIRSIVARSSFNVSSRASTASRNGAGQNNRP